MAHQPGVGVTYGESEEIPTEHLQPVEILINMFGDTMNKDALCTVVESCGGDLAVSIEAVMSIVNDTNKQINTQGPSTSVQGPSNDVMETSDLATLNLPQSYASTSQLVQVPKQPQKTMAQTPKKIEYNAHNIQTIVSYHIKGHRILVLMRGPPGCGKSHLAKTIIAETVGSDPENLSAHIFSADDYFFVGQRYMYDRFKIGDAHSWNQARVFKLLREGFSPIIVDNTNIEIWEMKPYVMQAVREGYIIEVVQPDTPWAKNANLLAMKNNHSVPLHKIKRILENFSDNISGHNLMKILGAKYPDHKIPPVQRNYPPIQEQPKVIYTEPNQQVSNNIVTSQIKTKNDNLILKKSVVSIPQKLDNPPPLHINQSELEKLEQEWEMGEKWEEQKVTNDNAVNKEIVAQPKPQRSTQNPVKLESISSLGKWDDWREITKFLPPWEEHVLPGPSSQKSQQCSDRSSKYTCIERGDTNTVDSKYIIISTTPRDINFYYMPLEITEIPNKFMVSRSTSTADENPMSMKKCQFEAQHFNTLRKMFKNIPKPDLKEIFDFCNGDVHWCFNILLDGVHSQYKQTHEEDDMSDLDDYFDGQCDCLAAYNIVPDARSSIPKDDENEAEAFAQPLQAQQKRVKKDKTVPSALVELKKKIEENVQIGENHYSQHCLKIKKFRRGEVDVSQQDNGSHNQNTSDTPEHIRRAEECAATPSCSTNVNDDSPDEEAETMNVNLGREFVVQLDEMFGRSDMIYPVNIAPVVNMPVSTLNEINALWIESLTHQIEMQEKYSDILLKQDEEFAKKLAEKEAELALNGEEPACPDFQEIMDMDLALSLHEKDVATWRKNIPNDLASKMTREKLNNLFPEIAPEVLSELLMAYDNNFQSTVEVLLTSTDRASLLEQKNGLNKFIIEKQIERQRELNEQANKQTLVEAEWPLLGKVVKLTMADVENFRHLAQKHLQLRNNFYTKANEYIGRGMTLSASYYSEVAAYHKLRFEQSNSKAASSLIQVHATNHDNQTLDLHYLYVAEALEALDLFLDYHIQRLRAAPAGRSERLFLITGRGLHSVAGPRIKPAVRRRVSERGLQGTLGEVNAGLYTVTVRASSRLSEEI